MIKEFILEAVAVAKLPQGKTKLVLDDTQMLELYNDLHAIMFTTPEEDLVKARTFFFEEEGYMANDAIVESYWDVYYEER